MATTVTIKINDNQGYSADQITTSMTLADMLESIEEAIVGFGADAKVVLSNGQRYGAGYGSFLTSYGQSLVIQDAEEDEDY